MYTKARKLRIPWSVVFKPIDVLLFAFQTFSDEIFYNWTNLTFFLLDEEKSRDRFLMSLLQAMLKWRWLKRYELDIG